MFTDDAGQVYNKATLPADAMPYRHNRARRLSKFERMPCRVLRWLEEYASWSLQLPPLSSLLEGYGRGLHCSYRHRFRVMLGPSVSHRLMKRVPRFVFV